MEKTFLVNEKGFYGEFGGAYVPEILYATVKKLQEEYLPVIESESFQKEYMELLRDYVGRPSPLYYAKRMSEKYGCQALPEARRPEPHRRLIRSTTLLVRFF